jgi:hypothetical protein
MPQPGKYTNRAEQQAAYRRRCAEALRRQMQTKGLPAFPPIPSTPGTARWRAAAAMAYDLLTTVCDEMQQYADDRSDQWRDSDRLTGIENIRDALSDYC